MTIGSRDSVDILRSVQGIFSERGNAVDTFIEIPVDNVLIEWSSSSTDISLERVIITSGARLYFPSGTVIEDEDEFLIYGDRYKKNGVAEYWRNPIGFNLKPRVVVNVTREEG